MLVTHGGELRGFEVRSPQVEQLDADALPLNLHVSVFENGYRVTHATMQRVGRSGPDDGPPSILLKKPEAPMTDLDRWDSRIRSAISRRCSHG